MRFTSLPTNEQRRIAGLVAKSDTHWGFRIKTEKLEYRWHYIHVIILKNNLKLLKRRISGVRIVHRPLSQLA